MEKSGLHNTFEQDTKNFINEINESLIKLENSGYSTELINHIFRCIHSIKSEAAYLKLDEIAKAAHDMESAIEPMRNVGHEVEVDPALIEFCFKTLDKIENLSAEPEELVEEVFEEATGKILVSGNEKPFYSDFEKMLLRDARSRDEKLYSLSFGISDDEAMKYPRAYLAVSNLEQQMNVIKTDPAPEDMDLSACSRMHVILSTAMPREKILDDLNIDQIENIQIELLELETELTRKKETSNETEEPSPEESTDAEAGERSELPRDRVIRVEADEIDAISDYVNEIKQRITDLSSAVSGTGEDEGIENSLAGLESISANIENVMENLQTVYFNSHFSGFKRTVRDLASDLGKKASLDFAGNNLRMQRDFAELIAEPLLQVVRNAVVHGIEMPEERRTAGKEEAGSITVDADSVDDEIVIRIKDDGRGIDISALDDEYSGIETDGQLLELLTQPGYTTLDESKPFGGRGVGLDLVAEKIKGRGGRLELENIPGKSCIFSMIFPQ